MISKKEFIKTIAFFVVLFIFCYLLVLTINPLMKGVGEIGDTSEKHHQQNIHLDYPPLDESNIITIKNSSPQFPLFSVDIGLQYNGDLVEGTPVNVSAIGFVYPEGQKVISGISDDNQNIIYKHVAIVGFNNAIVYNESIKPADRWEDNFIWGETYVNLLERTTPNRARSDINSQPINPVLQTIVWTSEGDYYPFVSIVTHENETRQYTHAYQNMKIHVSGEELKRQENVNRINTWLTIALFCFTLIMSCEFLFKLCPIFILNWLGIEGDCKDPQKAISDDPNKNTQIQSQNAENNCEVSTDEQNNCK
jgi:hypothetical protein